ncbi:MAG: type II toxin-antitoxin system HicB family antitoxin [Oscillibacter sp.]|nr:type II toxin-antitoxin system HicB family antitoxin [Oscillibacter sp.]MBQ9618137.1 type II toxin-antitoxin system HicB family antitoxin [Oscillibacter sp.]
MKKVTYLAVFEPGKDGYSVYFPDLPGCISYGGTFEEARTAAADALGLCLYGMEQDGETIPAPSEHPAVDPETAAGYLVCPVTVFPSIVRNELDNRRVKTNVTIPAWLKEAAERKHANYSRILESALMDYLDIPRPVRNEQD